MKKLLVFVLLCLKISFATAQADSSTYHLPEARNGMPLVVFNQHIIGSLNINPNDIETVTVTKDSAVIVPGFKNPGRFGIVWITLKKQVKVDVHTFKEIKNWFNITDSVRFAVDGYFIDDENLQVVTQSIAGIDILKNNQQNYKGPNTINVRTVGPSISKSKAKPGEIILR